MPTAPEWTITDLVEHGGQTFDAANAAGEPADIVVERDTDLVRDWIDNTAHVSD